MARPMEERLQKFLAHCGIASRRECEVLIEEGRVQVNGTVVTRLGTKIDTISDNIHVDGERVKSERPVYYLVNKPRGYLCTSDDTHGRARVIDLVKEDRRIYTVGRLDEDSEGLIVLTNDGALTNVLTHPRYQLDKTYKLLVRGHISPDTIRKIEQGVWLSDGKTAPADIRRVARKGPNTIVTVTLWEGRNRELRRMFAKVGLRVQHLNRIAIGPLRVDGLPIGAYRRLEKRELAFAYARLSSDWKPRAKVKAEANKNRRSGKKRQSTRSTEPSAPERPASDHPAARRGRPSGRPTGGRNPSHGRRPPR